jgi:hypothetical protein
MVVIDSPVHLAGSDVFMPMSEDQALGTRVSHGPYAIRDLLSQSRYLLEWADADQSGAVRAAPGVPAIEPTAVLAPTLAEAARAPRLLETGATTGKLVLKP